MWCVSTLTVYVIGCLPLVPVTKHLYKPEGRSQLMACMMFNFFDNSNR